MKIIAVALIALVVSAASAGAKTICNVIADAQSGEILLEQGDCRSRVTSGLTFKIQLSRRRPCSRT